MSLSGIWIPSFPVALCPKRPFAQLCKYCLATGKETDEGTVPGTSPGMRGAGQTDTHAAALGVQDLACGMESQGSAPSLAQDRTQVRANWVATRGLDRKGAQNGIIIIIVIISGKGGHNTKSSPGTTRSLGKVLALLQAPSLTRSP